MGEKYTLKTTWFTPWLPYNAILDSIMNYRIDTIPTQWLTPNFEDRTADGTTYIIELSTKHFYKCLTYRNPKYYQEISHQKINAFVIFLFKQFRGVVLLKQEMISFTQ